MKNYLNYILESDSSSYSSAVSRELGALVWEGDPIISVKVINVLNEDFWKSNKTKETLRTRFLNLSNPVQNALIRRFVDDPVSKDYLLIYMHLLQEVNETQRSQIYIMLESNVEKLDNEMKVELCRIFKSAHYPVSVKEYKLMNTLGIKCL